MLDRLSPEALLSAARAERRDPQLPQARESAAPDFTYEFPDALSAPTASWLVHGLLPSFGVGFLYGPTGTGKSFLAVDLACRLACGLSVLGHDIEDIAGALYVAAEDADGIRCRIKAWTMRHEHKERFPLALIPHAPRLNDADSVAALKVCVRAAADEMEASTGVRPRVIILDTLSSVSPGMHGNEDADASAQIAVMRSLADEIDGVCLTVHHPGKNAALGMRGSYVYQADADFFLSMENDKSDPTVSTVTVGKLKNGSAGKTHAVRLSDPIEIGADDKGRPVTSCVMLEGEPPKPQTKSKRLSPTNAMFFENIRGAIDTYGRQGFVQAAGYVAHSVARADMNRFLIDRELLDTERNAADTSASKHRALTNGARSKLQRTLNALRHNGLIGFDKSTLWLTATASTGQRNENAQS